VLDDVLLVNDGQGRLPIEFNRLSITGKLSKAGRDICSW